MSVTSSIGRARDRKYLLRAAAAWIVQPSTQYRMGLRQKKKIAASPAVTHVQAGGNAFYGLQQKGSSPSACVMLEAMITRLAESPAVLDTQHTGIALYGLQR